MMGQFIAQSVATAAGKKATTGAMAGLAIFGIVENDIPLFIAVFIGLIGGTLAAWAREKQSGRQFPPNWILMQAASYILIFVLVLALREYPGLTTRWAAATAGMLSFASREGLQALHRRTIKEIEEREL